MTVKELRTMADNTLEVKEDTKTVTGYAVKWDKKSHPIDSFDPFREQFRKGAFIETLKRNNQFAFWAHDSSDILGSVKGGNLKIFEDEVGLRFELDFMDSEYDNRKYELIRKGIVDGVSFAFVPSTQEWDVRENDIAIRTITQAELFEISPGVAFQAYPDSTAAARGLNENRDINNPLREYLNNQEEREKLLLETYL